MTHAQEQRIQEKSRSVEILLKALPQSFKGRDEVLAVAKMDTRYFDDPSFRKPKQVEALFAKQLSFDVNVLETAWNLALCDANYDDSSFAQRTLLSPEEEKTVFLQYNYARCKMSEFIAMSEKGKFEKSMVFQVVRWAELMKRCRDTLIVANLGLVFSMGRRCDIFSNPDTNELLTDGFYAIMRAVDGFDLSRGFKFSTYACRSIIQSMNRGKGKITKRLKKEFPSSLNITADCKITEPDIGWMASISDLKLILAENRAELTGTEQFVIKHRFFNGKKLHEVGHLLGANLGIAKLSKERVRQIQNKAINKIREALNA